MDVEDFKKKYEQLKDNPMYKNFCSILDTKSQVLERTAKENQELKKQLEDHIKAEMKAKDESEKLRKEYQETYKDVRVEIKEYKTQQKEFIEWLEDKINFWKDKIFENAITENDWTLTLWRNKLGILEESLSKYKEIIGGLNDE